MFPLLKFLPIWTDHSFSDRRIALQTIVLGWLESLPGNARGAKN